MTTLAATVVNWDALWKIGVSALVGGAGVVMAFGLALLALERASTAGSRAMRVTHRTVAGVCGAICIATIAIGLYAMAHKHASKSGPKPARAALSAQPRAID